MTERTVTLPGARLLVADDGPTDAPAIHLLHAGIVDLRSWDDLVPRLVAGGYRVVRHDLRGFGRTTTEDVPFSNRADVIAVLDALGIERVALIGNSRGGIIAFDTALEYPERIVAVVGVGAGFGGYEAELPADQLELLERMDALEEALAESIGAERARILDEAIELETRIWVDGPGQPAGRAPAAVRDAVSRMNREVLGTPRPEGQPIPLEPNALSRIADLRMPVLAIAGTLDVAEAAATARWLEATAPNARAEIVPDVAHMIGMEAPDLLAERILEFLAPLPRWS